MQLSNVLLLPLLLLLQVLQASCAPHSSMLH
jgi:hypothetical protein